jgi:hypothetical protein
MSYVIAATEYVASAATDLANIGSAVGDANAAAVAPTLAVFAPAGADEVSAQVAALFGAHAEAYQAFSAQAALFHNQFVALMSSGAEQYALTEAVNNSSVQTLEQGLTAVTAPGQALVGGLTGGGTHGPVTSMTAPMAAYSSAKMSPPPAAAVAAGSVGSAGLPGSSTAAAGSTVMAGSTVPAGSGALLGRQPIQPLPASPALSVESSVSPLAASPVSAATPLTALPATAATRAAPAAEPTPANRWAGVGDQEASPA